MSVQSHAQTHQMHPLLKIAVEIGPLVAFFIVNARLGLFWATGVFMVTAPLAVLITWRFERRVPVLPLVTAGFVLVFGGLTLILQDELFIKMKPTIVNCLFAAGLLGGLAFDKSFLKSVMGPAMPPLHEDGWRILTWRWGLFFLFLALLNEIVWRNFSTDAWVNFKVFGIMPLTFVFAISQLPTVNRFMLEPDEKTP